MNKQSSLWRELSPDEICRIVRSHFRAELHSAVLLNGGLFNTTYKICYGDAGHEAVLRCGPVSRHLLLPFEKNLMRAECHVYSLCAQSGIPCSEVLVCDTRRRLIDRDFTVMRFIDGLPMSDSGVPSDCKPALHAEVGRYIRRMHALTGPSFGRVSQVIAGRGHTGWYAYLMHEVSVTLRRLVLKGGLTEEESRSIRSVFTAYRPQIETVAEPRLLHCDLWEGNVLVDRGDHPKVAAIIDADRAVYGDVDFEFASPWMINSDFLAGYGSPLDADDFGSENRKLKRKIYGILYALIDTYVCLVEYHKISHYEDHKKKALKTASELNGLHSMIY